MLSRLRREGCIFLLVLAAAFSLRLVMALQTPVLAKDGVGYIAAVRGGLEAGAASRSPFYPLCIRAAGAFTDDPVLAGKMVALLAGTAFTVLVWLLARRLWPGTRAWPVFLLAAFQPYLIRYSGDVLTEPLYLCLMAALLLAARLAVSQSLYAAIAGVFGAALFLTRPEGALVVMAVLFTLFFGDGKPQAGRRKFTGSILFLGVVLLIAGVFRGLGEQGEDPQRLLAQTYAESLSKMEGSALPEEPPLLSEFMVEEPGRFLKKSFLGLALAPVKLLEALHPLVFLLALLGLWGVCTGRLRPAGMGGCTLSAVLLFLFFALISPTKRHLLQCAIPLLLWAGWALEGFAGSKPGREKTARLFLAGICLACSLKAGFSQRQDKLYLREGGERIAAQSGDRQPLVITSSTRLAFYAGAKRIEPRILQGPEGNLDRAQLEARIAGWPTGCVFYVRDREDRASQSLLENLGIRVFPLRGETSKLPDAPP